MHTLLVHRHDCRLCGVVLKASDQLAEEDMATLKVGKDFMAEVKQPRSLPHHRLFFAMIRKVAQSTPTPLDEQALLSWIKVRTGHVVFLPLGFGKSYEAPASISWHAMDQAAFRDFFDRAVQLVLTEIAPNLPPSFADEFLAMLDNPSERLDAQRPPASAEAAEPPSASSPQAETAALHSPSARGDLTLHTREEALAWADEFTAKLERSGDQITVEKYWTAAKQNGRLAALHRFDAARFQKLTDFVAAMATRNGWKSTRRTAA